MLYDRLSRPSWVIVRPYVMGTAEPRNGVETASWFASVNGKSLPVR